VSAVALEATLRVLQAMFALPKEGTTVG